MSKVMALTVVLETDKHDDDAQPIINAVKQIRGVISVTGVASDVMELVAEMRVRSELGLKLMKVLYPDGGK